MSTSDALTCLALTCLALAVLGGLLMVAWALFLGFTILAGTQLSRSVKASPVLRAISTFLWAGRLACSVAAMCMVELSR